MATPMCNNCGQEYPLKGKHYFVGKGECDNSMSNNQNKGEKKGWERHYRNDKGVWEDTCIHGIGHEMGVHGCDGCCNELYGIPEPTPQSEEKEEALCQLCGNPMPKGEEMFNYHGYSSNCHPKKENVINNTKKELDIPIPQSTTLGTTMEEVVFKEAGLLNKEPSFTIQLNEVMTKERLDELYIQLQRLLSQSKAETIKECIEKIERIINFKINAVKKVIAPNEIAQGINNCAINALEITLKEVKEQLLSKDIEQ